MSEGVSRGAVRAQSVEAGTGKQGCEPGLRCTLSTCIDIPDIPLRSASYVCTCSLPNHPSSPYFLLPPDDDMLQESGIYTGQVMILEVKKDDGTWPRKTK